MTGFDAESGAHLADVGVDVSNVDDSAFIVRPKLQGPDPFIVAVDELAKLRPNGAFELMLKTFPGPMPAGGRPFTALFDR